VSTHTPPMHRTRFALLVVTAALAALSVAIRSEAFAFLWGATFGLLLADYLHARAAFRRNERVRTLADEWDELIETTPIDPLNPCPVCDSPTFETHPRSGDGSEAYVRVCSSCDWRSEP
jgi:hypothetical protein